MTTVEGPSQEGCLEIGRITNIRDDIDPGKTITNFLRTKMSIIDLIPCLFTVDYSSLLTVVDNKVKTHFAPTIEYSKAITDYMATCQTYGLEPWEFLRLNLTDMTSVTDDMSNEYSKSVIDDAFNSLTSSRIGQLLQKGYKSAESLGKGEYIKDLTKKTNEVFTDVSGTNIGGMIDLAKNVLTHGSRISFPKIWSNSTYSPNLTCNVKLVSPYGHPKAINKFIIEPLCYLIILLSPSTNDGLITNKPRYLTMKSYGLSNLTLCYPGTMNIRRGGDDSSYNRYNQPLSVDISITFNAVTEGFACYRDEIAEGDTDTHPETAMLFNEDSIALQDFKEEFDQPNAVFPTLRSIVNSFRPYNLNKKVASDTIANLPNSTNASTISAASAISGGVIGEMPSEPLSFSAPTKASSSTALIMAPEVYAIALTSVTIYTSTKDLSSPPIYEAQISSDVSPTVSYEISTNDFVPNETITESTTETSLDGYTTTLTFANSQETQNVRLRNSTSDIPGAWSESVTINKTDEIANTTKLSVDIVPSYKNYTTNLKWQLIQNNEIKYGPFSGFLENVKYVIPDGYTLQIVNNNVIVQEFDIAVGDDLLVQEIIFEETYGNITSILDIPNELKKEDFSYYLISDFGDSILVDCYPENEYEYPEGLYYYIVKYKNDIILKQTPDIDSSVFIRDNVLVAKTIKIENINDQLLITSIV